VPVIDPLACFEWVIIPNFVYQHQWLNNLQRGWGSIALKIDLVKILDHSNALMYLEGSRSRRHSQLRIWAFNVATALTIKTFFAIDIYNNRFILEIKIVINSYLEFWSCLFILALNVVDVDDLSLSSEDWYLHHLWRSLILHLGFSHRRMLINGANWSFLGDFIDDGLESSRSFALMGLFTFKSYEYVLSPRLTHLSVGKWPWCISTFCLFRLNEVTLWIYHVNSKFFQSSDVLKLVVKMLAFTFFWTFIDLVVFLGKLFKGNFPRRLLNIMNLFC
jgi:hypothetical protein